MTHDVDLSETAIHHRVQTFLTRQGHWHDGATELLAYLGLARVRITLNGHTSYRTYRLPLIGLADPGIERLVLGEAITDSFAERNPNMHLPGIYLS